MLPTALASPADHVGRHSCPHLPVAHRPPPPRVQVAVRHRRQHHPLRRWLGMCSRFQRLAVPKLAISAWPPCRNLPNRARLAYSQSSTSQATRESRTCAARGFGSARGRLFRFEKGLRARHRMQNGNEAKGNRRVWQETLTLVEMATDGDAAFPSVVVGQPVPAEPTSE